MSLYRHLTLGKSVSYLDQYDADLLQTVPRHPQRAALGLDGHALPFQGEDIWTLYELSWLDLQGRPQVAIGELRIDALSPQLVESKSLKLYLNSLNLTHFLNWRQLADCVEQDLSQRLAGRVTLRLYSLSEFAKPTHYTLPGIIIDEQPSQLPFETTQGPDPTQLLVTSQTTTVEEQLVSHLFRSNCPVTGQPDWASVQVHYQGLPIDREALLRYLLSFRRHAGFHEQCVEQIFCDLIQYCQCQYLSVLARFTRRGGIDINPFRSNWQPSPQNQRLTRQ